MQPPHQPPQGQPPYNQPPWDPSQYNQPTQAWNAQPPPYGPGRPPTPPAPPRKPRRKLWRILAIVGGILVLCCVICSVAVAMTPTPKGSSTANTGSFVTATKPVTQVAFVATTTPTLAPTIVLSPTPSPTPNPTPTPKPTPSPTPRPTQPPAKPTPTPAPKCQGVNGNPWCYNFSPGSLIYQPNAAFCNYFTCVSTFWVDTSGYVAECANGSYTHSGGVRGACSRDGGVAQTLYSH